MKWFQATFLVAAMVVGYPTASVADEQVVLQSNTVVFHIEGMT